MKKKICRWLDSDEMGGLQLLNNKIYPCCNTETPIIDRIDLDYSTISKEELQKARMALFKGINDGTNTSCKGCLQLKEKEESEIEIGAIHYLSLGTFSTCNLRCRYCYFSHEELGAKLDEKYKKIFPIVKNFYRNGLLKEATKLGLAGGEPLLIEDISETLKFLAKNLESPSFTFLSNSSITNKVEILAPKLSKLSKNLAKTLYTSIDAGTPETYKNIRGRDLYYEAFNNIINYAKQGSFDEIILKYILMLDYSNTSDEDIFGFLNMVKLVDQNNSKKTFVVIDRDATAPTTGILEDKIIAAAGKIYYAADKILKLKIEFCGGAITEFTKNGKSEIARIKEFAKKYEFEKKSTKETYYLNLLATERKKKSEKIQPSPTTQINSTRVKNNVEKLIDNNKNKNICLYGAGSFATQFLEKFDLSELNVIGIIDKDINKKGIKVGGYTVYSPDDINSLDPEAIVLTVLEKRYSLPSLKKLKKDKGYTFKIIHNLFQP